MVATLGQLIRERRMELNLTQEELAERVGDGVRQSEISRLEKNRVTLPRRQRMEQLAAALDVPIGLLLARSGWAGAESIEAEAPEAVQTEPADELNVVEPASLEQAVERGDVPWPDHTGGNGHHPSPVLPLEDSSSLNEAVLRSEALLGEARAIYSEVQTSVMQARESVKRRRDDES